MTDIDPDYGDHVTYYDGDGEPENAIVVDPVEDDKYVTVVTGASDELGDGYNHDVEAHSSVHPHAELGDEYTATSYAFKPGWDDEEE